MSDKVALSSVVAENVRRWRVARGLDQQGLADRLGRYGWQVDRTTVTRIEKGRRNVTVDDLAALAVALNVPISLLLLPVHETVDIELVPEGLPPVHRWRLWEWIRGEEDPDGIDGRESWSASVIFWNYDTVREAQLELHRVWPVREAEPVRFAEALQALVDGLANMEARGLPTDGLLAEEYAAAIRELEIVPGRRGRRFTTAEGFASQRAERDGGQAE